MGNFSIPDLLHVVFFFFATADGTTENAITKAKNREPVLALIITLLLSRGLCPYYSSRNG